jgi:hypothetical protein
MKFVESRPYADPEAAMRKVLEIASTIESIHRISNIQGSSFSVSFQANVALWVSDATGRRLVLYRPPSPAVYCAVRDHRPRRPLQGAKAKHRPRSCLLQSRWVQEIDKKLTNTLRYKTKCYGSSMRSLTSPIVLTPHGAIDQVLATTINATVAEGRIARVISLFLSAICRGQVAQRKPRSQRRTGLSVVVRRRGFNA